MRSRQSAADAEHPRRKPDSLFADRGYDHDIYRQHVRTRPIVPVIACRGTYRWAVERTFAWPHGFKRLRIRWERRADIHGALLKLACGLGRVFRIIGSLVWCVVDRCPVGAYRAVAAGSDPSAGWAVA
jgi:hypothetical protein